MFCGGQPHLFSVVPKQCDHRPKTLSVPLLWTCLPCLGSWLMQGKWVAKCCTETSKASPKEREYGTLKSVNMADQGHKWEFALSVTIVCTFLKGSVLVTSNQASIYLGEDVGMNAEYKNVRWSSGLKWESQVSSSIWRKPKKVSVIAA